MQSQLREMFIKLRYQMNRSALPVLRRAYLSRFIINLRGQLSRGRQDEGDGKLLLLRGVARAGHRAVQLFRRDFGRPSLVDARQDGHQERCRLARA